MIDIYIGTRPEAIKLCPVVLAIRDCGGEVRVIDCKQHIELDSYFQIFGVKADIKLNPPPWGNHLAAKTSWIMEEVSNLIGYSPGDCSVVQGDTATVFAVAMSSFLHQVPVFHVEAGLRTNNLGSPFPEEGFRQIVSRIASVNYCPTELSRQNLIAEGIDLDKIMMVGNTIVDGVRLAIKGATWPSGVSFPSVGKKFIVVTCHRRENWGDAACRLATFIKGLNRPEVCGVVVTHQNQDAAEPFLDISAPFDVIPPVSYSEMLGLLKAASLVITDSGGLVEECTSLGVPVAIYRDSSERMESVMAGCACMAFSDGALNNAIDKVMDGKWLSDKKDLFGDGHSAEYIAKDLKKKGYF